MKIEDLPVTKYSPEAGDVLIVEAERRISRDTLEKIRAQVKSCFEKDTKVMVLEGGMKLKVVREDDLERWEGEGGR